MSAEFEMTRDKSGCKLRPYKFLSQVGFEPGSFGGYNQLRDGMSP